MLQYAYRDFMGLLDSVVSSLCNYQEKGWELMREGEKCCGERRGEGIMDG